MKYYNSVSVIIGAVLTAVLCLIWLAFVPAEPVFQLGGVAAIIFVIFFAGREKLPSVSQGILEVTGRRRSEIRFGEGWAWTLVGISRILQDTAKQKTISISPIDEMANDEVEVRLDGIQLLARVTDPSKIIRLEGELNVLPVLILGKAREAFREYVVKHSSKECVRARRRIQTQVKRRIEKEVAEFGVEITAVDVGPIFEAEEIRIARRKNKAKELDVERFTEDVKKIEDAIPGLTPKERTDTVKLAHKLITEERKESTNINRFESSTIEKAIVTAAEIVAMFLPKKSEGDKK